MTSQPNRFTNILLWSVVGVLLFASLWVNYAYSSLDISLRLIAWLVAMAVMLGIASRTRQGLRAWVFGKEALVELRKVVWPTRQETLKITAMLIVLVILIALIIWGMDTVFLYLVGWLTGQRG